MVSPSFIKPQIAKQSPLTFHSAFVIFFNCDLNVVGVLSFSSSYKQISPVTKANIRCFFKVIILVSSIYLDHQTIDAISVFLKFSSISTSPNCCPLDDRIVIFWFLEANKIKFPSGDHSIKYKLFLISFPQDLFPSTVPTIAWPSSYIKHKYWPCLFHFKSVTYDCSLLLIISVSHLLSTLFHTIMTPLLSHVVSLSKLSFHVTNVMSSLWYFKDWEKFSGRPFELFVSHDTSKSTTWTNPFVPPIAMKFVSLLVDIFESFSFFDIFTFFINEQNIFIF